MVGKEKKKRDPTFTSQSLFYHQNRNVLTDFVGVPGFEPGITISQI